MTIRVCPVSHSGNGVEQMWCAERGENSEQFPVDYLEGIDDSCWWGIVTSTTVGYGAKTVGLPDVACAVVVPKVEVPLTAALSHIRLSTAWRAPPSLCLALVVLCVRATHVHARSSTTEVITTCVLQATKHL